MRPNTTVPYDGQTVYLGMDVHAKSIVVQPALRTTLLKRFTITPADASILIKKLNQDFAGATFEAVYEAGFSGFWLHRALTQVGISCVIVNPADVASSDKDKRRKTDAKDASKLVRELRNGTLSGIYIPDRQAEKDRHLVRLREELVKDERRAQQRIKAYLKLAHDLPSEWPSTWRLSKTMIAKVRAFASIRWEGQPDHSLLTRLDHLANVREQLDIVNTRIKLVVQTRHPSIYKCLLSIPGLGPITAAYLILELIDINRFDNQDKLCAYVGLVPDLHSSGQRARNRAITRRANHKLRRMLIEASWVAIRSDKILAAAYGRYTQRMIANKAIIKIARKLLGRIRAVWQTQKPYEMSLSR